jgi:hypothetical protein
LTKKGDLGIDVQTNLYSNYLKIAEKNVMVHIKSAENVSSQEESYFIQDFLGTGRETNTYILKWFTFEEAS